MTAPPRTAVIIAHPDDESVGLGGQLMGLRTAHFLYVTDGSPRELCDAHAAGFSTRSAYARARRKERDAALARAGIAPALVSDLDIVDREAMFHLADLTRCVADFFRRIEPEIVVTHPYEGGHPDHDACAFAVQQACRGLRNEGISPPLIVEMSCYHGRGGRMNVGSFLPALPGPWVVELTAPARELKQSLLATYATQEPFLSRFPVDREYFRRAPRYAFCEPPHEGVLLYETFGFEISGEAWRRRAQAALLELGWPSRRG